ncbi:MAG TPA: cation:proton antiporter [Polyangiaceae bacterium]|jgi:CPA2 family monovalent cation:H+ antiporter-2|nr:cation:proton antiporter [Polyangiaceae bacterium]
MHSVELVFLLSGALGAALVFGLIVQRLKLPPIVGYLLAGVLVGPHTPGFVANAGLASQLAEVGVVLLLFGVGLEFHVEHLLAVRAVAVPAAIVQMLAVALAGAAAGVYGFGWSTAGSAVFGLALSITSTVVLLRALADRGELHTMTGHLAVGWLVVEDILTVLVLVLLPGLVKPSGQSIVMGTIIAVLKIGALVGFTFVAGGRAIPWLLRRVVATGSRELFTLAVLAVALVVGLGAAELFGASMALGAFLAGVVVGRSEFASRAATEALPMRDAFAVLFFVSVGMLFEPSFLWREPALVAAALGVTVVVKPLVSALLLVLFRRPARMAVTIGLARGQLAEFSFILTGLGAELGVLPPKAASAVIAASILSITLNPLLLALTPRASLLVPERTPEEGRANGSNDSNRHRVIVVGYGPIGRTVTRLFRESGLEPSVVELNLDTVRKLREEGVRAVYGDASRSQTLEEAGARNAIGIVLTTPVEGGADAVVRRARELNARLFVVARSTYLTEVGALKSAGADVVFSGEGEVALAMTEFTLRRLGATPEQIDRERDRVHGELGTAKAAVEM